MPRLSRRASKHKKRARMQEEMDKYKRGEMHSGSRYGKKVTSRKQAIAIGPSESGQSKNGRKKRSYKR